MGNKRTSGPVDAHIIFGIYLNSAIHEHVYNPRTGEAHQTDAKY